MVLVTPLFAFKLFISSENDSSWTSLMMVSSASFLSSKLVALLVLCLTPVYSWTFHFSLATAFTALDQSENFCRRSKRDLSSLALVLHTRTLRSSGSSSLISPTLGFLLGSSLRQRNFGPVNPEKHDLPAYPWRHHKPTGFVLFFILCMRLATKT